MSHFPILKNWPLPHVFWLHVIYVYSYVWCASVVGDPSTTFWGVVLSYPICLWLFKVDRNHLSLFASLLAQELTTFNTFCSLTFWSRFCSVAQAGLEFLDVFWSPGVRGVYHQAWLSLVHSDKWENLKKKKKISEKPVVFVKWCVKLLVA